VIDWICAPLRVLVSSVRRVFGNAPDAVDTMSTANYERTLSTPLTFHESV
jgi:hypothetical protein